MLVEGLMSRRFLLLVHSSTQVKQNQRLGSFWGLFGMAGYTTTGFYCKINTMKLKHLENYYSLHPLLYYLHLYRSADAWVKQPLVRVHFLFICIYLRHLVSSSPVLCAEFKFR